MYVPNAHAPTPPPGLDRYAIIQALDCAAAKGREVLVKRFGDSAAAKLTRRDCLVADLTVGIREMLGIRSADAAGAAGVREFVQSVHRVGDAAPTVPLAGQFIAGPPVKPIFRPTRLLEAMPSFELPVWTDVTRFDYLDYTGQVQWGRGGDTSMPVSDYTVTSQYAVTPEVVWTSTNLHWLQEQRAQSPNYAISPAAEKANAAMTVINQALESALVSTPSGVGFQSLANTNCLRGVSALTYGTDPVQDCLRDFTVFLQKVSELSLGIFQPDTLLITQRVINRLAAPVVTSTGYPFDPASVLASRISEYGITNMVIVPSLQDAGGTNVDRTVLLQSGAGGLKRYSALEPTIVRTSVTGLNTQSFVAALPAGVYASYRASSYVYDIPIA